MNQNAVCKKLKDKKKKKCGRKTSRWDYLGKTCLGAFVLDPTLYRRSQSTIHDSIGMFEILTFVSI